MPVKVRPAEAGKVAVSVRAVVAKEEHGVSYDVLVGVFDSDIAVDRRDVGVGILLERLRRILSKNDKGSCGLVKACQPYHLPRIAAYA